MILYRRHSATLLEWKDKVNRKPLVIRGARQVGKTHLVRQFAKQAFRYFIEVNFDETPSRRDLFTPDDVGTVLQYLSLDAGVPIVPGETLVFLDEVQQAPEILARLRYLHEHSPALHIIAAGSLLDFVLAEHEFAMPVGRIEYLHLGPLDFYEFVRATGNDGLAKFVHDFSFNRSDAHTAGTIPESIHRRLVDLVRLYMGIGGMPAVVREYVRTGAILSCDAELSGLIQTIRDDFAKYSGTIDVDLLRRVFDRAPAFVGRKLKYSEIDRDAKAARIARAIEQLERARLVHRVFHSSGNAPPLRAERKERAFKLLYLDSGLMMKSLGARASDLVGSDLMTGARGPLAEQMVGRQWFDTCPWYEQPELHYWNREKAGRTAEVDYLVQVGGAIVPIEVKAGSTGGLKSLHVFASEKRSRLALRFSMDHPRIDRLVSRVPRMEEHEFTLLSLPLYLATEADRLIREVLGQEPGTVFGS